VALLEEIGTEREECVTPRGTARVWTLSPTIYVTQTSGYLEEAHAAFLESYGARRIQAARGRKLRVFHDWIDMTGYDSQCRTRMTAWSLKHLREYAEVHIALRSKIVAMGVQVANIALRGIIQAHNDRTRVEVELRRALREESGPLQG